MVKKVVTLFILTFLMYVLVHSQNLQLQNPVLFQNIKNGNNFNDIINLFLQDLPINSVNKTQEGTYKDIGQNNSAVVSIAINNQGTLLAAGYEDGQVKLWNIKTGGVIKSISAHTGSVSALKFSNNDLSLASAGNDKIINIWNVSSGALLSTFSGHTGLIKCLVFSHDGTKLASGSSDRTVKIWSLPGKSLLASLTAHSDVVNSIDYSGDDSKLASAGADSTIKIWNTVDWKVSVELKGHRSAIYSVVFFPDGVRLASGSGDCDIRIWNSIIGDTLAILKSHTGLVKNLAFSLDGKKLFSGSYDNTVKTWESMKYGLLKTIKCTGVLQSISSDGSKAALGVGDAINVWDLDSNKQYNVLSGHTGSISSLAVSNDGKLIASGSWDKTVKLWDIATGNLYSTFQGHTDGILSLAFSPDGERLATGSFDNTVKVWAVKSGVLLYSCKDFTNFIWNVAFSPDGTMIACGSWDNTVRVLETASGRVLNTFLMAGSSLCFSPDNKKLVTGGFGILRVWDLNRGYVLKDLSTLAGDIVSMAYSPDGNRIAIGNINRSLNIWDMSSYTLTKTITGFSNSILSTAFSPDGSKILTGGGSSVDLWDSYSGNSLQTLSMDFAVTSTKFNNDGKTIAVTRDRYIRLYDVNTLLTGNTISGQIMYDGSALNDVTINLTGSSTLSSQTNANGYYSFIVLTGGSYSITPVKIGYSFNPATISISDLRSNKTGSFTATINKVTISGRVIYNNSPLVGTMVDLSVNGIFSQSKVSDPSGNYSFIVDANKTYSIKLSKTGYVFQPAEKTFTTLSENQTLDIIAYKTNLVDVESSLIPLQTGLSQNYPNPFNPSTTLKYTVAKSGIVSLKIYDVLGKEIETIFDKYHRAGTYSVEWNPNNTSVGLSSGIYYCRFSTGNVVEIRKMVYTR